MSYWVWVFGEIKALDWVAEMSLMAFASHASTQMARMDRGDVAVLYVTQGARHNPTRDKSRLAGLATVLSKPTQDQELDIAGRSFSWSCPIRIDLLVDENSGPLVSDLVAKLDLVRQTHSWGAYFRRSPLELSKHDFDIFSAALTRYAP
jgi:hypothetical protein